MSNASSESMRCGNCGAVDEPEMVRKGRGWLAVVLWFATGVFAVAQQAGAAIFFWLFVATLGATLIYTMYYFRAREYACMRCGSHSLSADLEP